GVFSVGTELASFRLPSEAAGGAALRPAPPRLLLGDDVEAILAVIAGIRNRARGMNPNMDAFLNLSTLYLRSVLESGPGALAEVEGPWSLAEHLKKKPVAGDKLEGCMPAEVEEVATRARDLIAALARVDEETITAISEAAAPVAQRAREQLLAAGFASFDALLQLARELRAHDPEARTDLPTRHRASLMDDLQENDRSAYRIQSF